MRVNFTHRYSDFSFHINNKCMSSFMIRFLSNDSWSFLDRFLWCHLKCVVWVFKSPFWEASMLGHGAGIGYTGPGWAPLTISVWWRGRKICQGQPPGMYSERSRFNPNRFTFGGVIPERVNTIKTGRKVFSSIRLKPSFEPNNETTNLSIFYKSPPARQNLHSKKVIKCYYSPCVASPARKLTREA